VHLPLYKGAFLDLTVREPENPAPVVAPVDIWTFLDAPVVPVLNPISVPLAIHIGTFMNTSSVHPVLDPLTMPLAIDMGTFMDAPVLETFDPLTVFLVFHERAT